MITSIVWLFLFLKTDLIGENIRLLWTVYLPIDIAEVVITLLLLPKICNLIDKLKDMW